MTLRSANETSGPSAESAVVGRGGGCLPSHGPPSKRTPPSCCPTSDGSYTTHPAAAGSTAERNRSESPRTWRRVYTGTGGGDGDPARRAVEGGPKRRHARHVGLDLLVLEAGPAVAVLAMLAALLLGVAASAPRGGLATLGA